MRFRGGSETNIAARSGVGPQSSKLILKSLVLPSGSFSNFSLKTKRIGCMAIVVRFKYVADLVNKKTHGLGISPAIERKRSALNCERQLAFAGPISNKQRRRK